MAFVFRRRGYLKTGKLGFNLAIEQNLFPLASDPLVFDLRHAVANCGCQDLVVGAERDFKRFLHNIVAVRVLNEVGELVRVADFDDKLRARLRVTPLQADLNYI